MAGCRHPDPWGSAIPIPLTSSTFDPPPTQALRAAAAEASRLLEQADWQLYIDIRRAGALGQAALDATSGQPTLALHGEAHFHVAFSLLRTGQAERGAEHNELARASFAAHDDARGLLMCDQFDALHLQIQGRLQDALALHLRILSRSAGVARRPVDLYICHNSRAITRKLLGQHDDMLLDFYEALSAAKACDSPGPRINALTNLGGSHTDLWNLGEAQKLSEEALDLTEAQGAWSAFAVAVFNLAQIYDGLGLKDRCVAMLERIRRNEPRMLPGVLARNVSLMAVAHLCAGDVEGAGAWLDPAVVPTASVEPDNPTDHARAQASYLMATGRLAQARDIVQARIDASVGAVLQDPPYSRMRLLQVATDICETLGDTAAALRHLRESQRLYETLLARSARAGFIATQVAHETALARDDRDRAREAQERAEVDRRRLATLNLALEERMRESQRLNDALQRKIAEAEALQEQLRDRMRRSDVICRFGGEEFLLLVDNCDEAVLAVILETAMRQFRAMRFGSGEHPLEGCTFSAGVAVLDADGDEFEALVRVADARMYRAKAAGRARVCWAAG